MSLNCLCHGVGAAGECISQLIRPSKPVRDTYPNSPKGHKVLGLILVGQEMKVIRRGTEPVDVFTFRHEDMPNEVMYAAKRCVHVNVEGPPESFFNSNLTQTTTYNTKQNPRKLAVSNSIVEGVEERIHVEVTKKYKFGYGGLC